MEGKFKFPKILTGTWVTSVYKNASWNSEKTTGLL